MMDSQTSGKALYDNLDTAFVNLWSLLRNLTERGFIGRVHVELEDYSADVFLTGSSTPLVHEIDEAAGTETLEEAALHRLVLRARGVPGKISVFEGSAEAVAVKLPSLTDQPEPAAAAQTDEPDFFAVPDAFAPPVEKSSLETSVSEETVSRVPDSESGSIRPTLDFPLLVSLGGEMVGAIERGTLASGEDFRSIFNAVRLELADDYSFLDPMANILSYANGVASMSREVTPGVFVSGLSEALRRTVDRVASGERERRVRERMALELLSVARKQRALENSGFRLQLDRIAGTKVI